MEKLKVGDKVFLKKNQRWGGTIPCIRNVVRLTKTRAVLNDGTHLVNNHIVCNNVACYPEYGDSWSIWNIATEDNLKEVAEYIHQSKIKNWWNVNIDKFTLKQKEQIYNLFKK